MVQQEVLQKTLLFLFPFLRHPTQNLRDFVPVEFVSVNKNSIMYGGPANHTESPKILEDETLHTKDTCHLSGTTSDDEQTTFLSLLWPPGLFWHILGTGRESKWLAVCEQDGYSCTKSKGGEESFEDDT